jgi:hypothetical protein
MNVTLFPLSQAGVLPIGLWREAARSYLADHGFALPKRWRERSGLTAWSSEAQRRQGAALLDRFRQPGIPAINVG